MNCKLKSPGDTVQSTMKIVYIHWDIQQLPRVTVVDFFVLTPTFGS